MPLRRYRTPSGDILEECGIARAIGLPDDGNVSVDDGRILRARMFVLRSPSGDVTSWYAPPKNSALDDYLYVENLHFVEGGVLYRGLLEMGGPAQLTCTISRLHVLLTGLTRID